MLESENEISENDTDELMLSIPEGFSFAGVASGIKKSGNIDLSLVVADDKCSAFGVFTQNMIRASSVDWNRNRIGSARGIVINSGNANACTGEQGEHDTESMARELADQIGCELNDVLVMSTGIIGEMLPMENVTSGIVAAFGQLQNNEIAFDLAAQGMMTTDKFCKVSSTEFAVGGTTYSVLGMAKGAGMIGPKMATMLCVLLTDFPLAASDEHNTAFKHAIDQSFNCISVDGHTSTSDQVVLLANSTGGSDGKSLPESNHEFFNQLTAVCIDLAKKIPSDGEGATHLISIQVSGPQRESELALVAKTIADSPLVKTAVFGGDPNWGRIVSAAGYSGIAFEPNETSLRVNGFLLFEKGTPVDFDEKEVSTSIKDNTDTEIELQIGVPKNSAQFWTSDLTYEYVKINAEYHT